MVSKAINFHFHVMSAVFEGRRLYTAIQIHNSKDCLSKLRILNVQK